MKILADFRICISVPLTSNFSLLFILESFLKQSQSFLSKQVIPACRPLSSVLQKKLLAKISRLHHASVKTTFADTQQKFDSRTTTIYAKSLALKKILIAMV